jgi:hypothetical protein
MPKPAYFNRLSTQCECSNEQANRYAWSAVKHAIKEDFARLDR